MLDKYTAPQKLHATSGGRFHVMAKPSGSTCNLDCGVWFYLSKETLPKGAGTGEMSDDTLELCPKNRLIRTPDGEPDLNYLCAGLKQFYKNALPEVERIASTIRHKQTSPGTVVQV